MNFPIPVLLYHRIDESALSTSTSPRVFRQHLQWLKQKGWQSLSAEEFCFAMRNESPLPARSFLITFDDGYASVRDIALEVLREFDFKAICFLATRSLRNPSHAEGASNPSSEGYLSWDQARELQSSGIVECQSHTHTHNNFSRYALNAIRRDLGASIDILSKELRLPRTHFSHLAWPWGLSRPEWRDAAATMGFKYQYGVSRRAARVGSPLGNIPRTCFDAVPFLQFRWQLRLQTNHLSPLWDAAYSMGKELRRFSLRSLKAEA